MTAPIQGIVRIANDVLADLAGYAALEVYGVVGMASPSLRDGVSQVLSLANAPDLRAERAGLRIRRARPFLCDPAFLADDVERHHGFEIDDCTCERMQPEK